MKYVLLCVSISVMSICPMEKKGTSETKISPVVPPIDINRVRFVSLGSKDLPKYSPTTAYVLSQLKKSPSVWDIQKEHGPELQKFAVFHRAAPDKSKSKSALVRQSITP